jgi:hypothetical protein
VQLFDQHKQQGKETNGSTYGFLTTGQKWLMFSVSNDTLGEDRKPLFRYHGMERLRVFDRKVKLKINLDDSGLEADEPVERDEISKVMAALASSLCM